MRGLLLNSNLLLVLMLSDSHFQVSLFELLDCEDVFDLALLVYREENDEQLVGSLLDSPVERDDDERADQNHDNANDDGHSDVGDVSSNLVALLLDEVE